MDATGSHYVEQNKSNVEIQILIFPYCGYYAYMWTYTHVQIGSYMCLCVTKLGRSCEGKDSLEVKWERR